MPRLFLAESVPPATLLALGELAGRRAGRTSADQAWKVGLDVGGAVTSLSEVTASDLGLRRVQRCGEGQVRYTGRQSRQKSRNCLWKMLGWEGWEVKSKR